MAVPVGIVAVLVVLAVCLYLWITGLNQIKQLRRELDETQRQLNDLRTLVESTPAPPPPLPRTRSSGLDDLREQLRASHREEESTE